MDPAFYKNRGKRQKGELSVGNFSVFFAVIPSRQYDKEVFVLCNMLKGCQLSTKRSFRKIGNSAMSRNKGNSFLTTVQGYKIQYFLYADKTL